MTDTNGSKEVAQLIDLNSTDEALNKKKWRAQESPNSTDQSKEPEPKRRQERWDKGQVKSTEYNNQQEWTNMRR